MPKIISKKIRKNISKNKLTMSIASIKERCSER